MKKINLNSICNENIFNNLFRTYSEEIYKYLLYKFMNEDLARESTQEAFIVLWDNCGKVDPNMARSYLYKVARNKTIDKLRAKKLEFEAVSDNSDNESPEYLMILDQFKSQLDVLLEEMPETQRIPFLLSRTEGKKYAEIAEILGISVKAVEKRMSKALKYFDEKIKIIKNG